MSIIHVWHFTISLIFCVPSFGLSSFLLSPRWQLYDRSWQNRNFKNPTVINLTPPAEITSRSSFVNFNISTKNRVGSQQLRSVDHTDVLTDFPVWQLRLLQFVNVRPLHGGARPAQTRPGQDETFRTEQTGSLQTPSNPPENSGWGVRS